MAHVFWPVLLSLSLSLAPHTLNGAPRLCQRFAQIRRRATVPRPSADQRAASAATVAPTLAAGACPTSGTSAARTALSGLAHQYLPLVGLEHRHQHVEDGDCRGRRGILSGRARSGSRAGWCTKVSPWKLCGRNEHAKAARDARDAREQPPTLQRLDHSVDARARDAEVARDLLIRRRHSSALNKRVHEREHHPLSLRELGAGGRIGG